MYTLKSLADKYSTTHSGNWLNEFDWRKVPVEFCELPCGIVGMYSLGKIKLLVCPDPGLIFPVYIHELRHRWQRVKRPLRYFAGKLYRPLIEDDADEQEQLAEYWYKEKCQ